jgi:hypothetical protein
LMNIPVKNLRLLPTPMDCRWSFMRGRNISKDIEPYCYISPLVQIIKCGLSWEKRSVFVTGICAAIKLHWRRTLVHH